MRQEIAQVALARRLDAAAASRLGAELLALRGRPVLIDAGEVELASGLAFEVLLSATRQWRLDGQTFGIGHGSTVFRAACATLALDGELPWAEMPEGAVP